jgi:hypothetical protein
MLFICIEPLQGSRYNPVISVINVQPYRGYYYTLKISIVANHFIDLVFVLLKLLCVFSPNTEILLPCRHGLPIIHSLIAFCNNQFATG